LPGGGGYMISGLLDVNPALAGQINNFATDSQKFGAWSNNFNGVDITLNVRTRAGWTIQGGTSTGQSAGDNCEVRRNLPELNASLVQGLPGQTTSGVSLLNPYCHVDYGWLTQLRGLTSYTIPKVDVQVSGVFQSKAGNLLAANYVIPASVVAQSLGRLPSGNVTNVTVNLVAPGSMYGDRLNELDLGIAKLLSFGRTRTKVGADIYNLLNSSAILTYNNAFIPGGAWLQPNSVLTGRLVRISAQFDF
jgi:hypothetical protein